VPGADADERAVIGVSWDEANQYAAWAGGALPDEAHWERAAPARRLFPWGDTWGAHGAWLDEQPYYDPWTRGAHPELASPDGMHDAITRRWEWCADVFTAADVAALDELYPALRADGRVRRGGEGSALVACAVARTGTRPSWRADGTGFRLTR
jgi:sulfatase modifying factor 1